MAAVPAPLEWTIDTGQHRCVIRSTDRRHGDFRVTDPEPGLNERRAAVAAGPWTWLRQVHGAEIVEVEGPGAHAGAEADGAVTFARNSPLAVTTADCAPVVLVGDSGVAVVHAGWRGAAAGIIGRAADLLRAGGARPVAAVLGPCIGPARYEFGAADLDSLASQFGSDVVSVTTDETPALDLPALVAVACEQAGWPRPERSTCTSGSAFYSHRVRRDAGRSTTVAWLESRETA